MSWIPTLAATAVVFAIVLYCGWRSAQAPNLSRGPRLYPYRMTMVLGSAVLFALVVHLAGLAGMLPQPRPF